MRRPLAQLQGDLQCHHSPESISSISIPCSATKKSSRARAPGNSSMMKSCPSSSSTTAKESSPCSSYRKWPPLLQQGKAIGCFGLTEPQFGSNPGGMLTRAEKKGSKYILNGEKMWITSGSIADVAVVWAKCEDEKIRGFLVEKGTPGFKAWDVHGKWSLRASVTSGLAFTDCEIPEENLLPNVVGLKGPLGCLNQARYGIGWGALGAAMACYDTALQYAKTRKQFANKPIASP